MINSGITTLDDFPVTGSYGSQNVIAGTPDLAFWLSALNESSVLTAGVPSVNNDFTDTWIDLRGGVSLTQPTAGKKPTRSTGINSLASLLFVSASSQYMESGSLPGLLNNVAGATCIFVLKPTSLAASGTIFATRDTAAAARAYYSVSTTGQVRLFGRRLDSGSGGASATASSNAGVVVNNTPALVAVQSNFSTGLISFFAGATNVAQGTADLSATWGTGSTSATSSSMSRVGISADGAPVSPLQGHVSEVIVYNRALTANEQGNIMALLGSEYGIS